MLYCENEYKNSIKEIKGGEKPPLIKTENIENENKIIYVLYNPEIIKENKETYYNIDGERRKVRNGIIEVNSERLKNILELKGFYFLRVKDEVKNGI